MRAKWLNALVLASAVGSLTGEQPKSSPMKATAASGVFLGKSGKPMAGARLILGEALEDKGKIRLLPNVPTATADKTGQFTIRGFDPGRYTLLYLPAGANAAIPNEIDLTPLEAGDKSPMPMLNRVELGTDTPNEPRPWTRQFTLMKGHTFWAQGQYMKIWNATIRRGATGPFLEFRKGRPWLQDFEDKSQIKFDAWSY